MKLMNTGNDSNLHILSILGGTSNLLSRCWIIRWNRAMEDLCNPILKNKGVT